MLYLFAELLCRIYQIFWLVQFDNEDTPAMLQLLDTRINLFSPAPGRQTLSPLIFGRDETWSKNKERKCESCLYQFIHLNKDGNYLEFQHDINAMLSSLVSNYLSRKLLSL